MKEMAAGGSKKDGKELLELRWRAVEPLHPWLLHVVTDVMPARTDGRAGFEVSGVVVLSPIAPEGLRLRLRSAGRLAEVRWGQPSQRMALTFPSGKNAGQARWTARVEALASAPIELQLLTQDGRELTIGQIRCGATSGADDRRDPADDTMRGVALPGTHAGRPPFFIVGCVRSGTTMLRDVLRLHPNLVSPEETHFFRWAEPFGTAGYTRTLTANPVLVQHRKLDGITEEEFQDLLAASISKADLCSRYMELFMARRKPGATRWFDKTPQNIYGAPLIAEMPGAKFVHIVRNPVEVVASLRLGKVMKVQELVGACSYWNEAAAILDTMKRAYADQVLEVRYEDFVRHPLKGVEQILAFLGEPFEAAHYARVDTREITHHDEGVLSAEEIARIEHLCWAGRVRYGYAKGPAA